MYYYYYLSNDYHHYLRDLSLEPMHLDDDCWNEEHFHDSHIVFKYLHKSLALKRVTHVANGELDL